MIIKVCGINQVDNLQALDELGLDMIGLNFYPKSKRYVKENGDFIIAANAMTTTTVGVFVAEDQQRVLDYVVKYDLDYVQLHGDESVEYCKSLQEHVKVIKVFRVDLEFDFSITKQFQFCDYLLFDTYTTAFGGSGSRFDWSVLNKYLGKTKYLLAGGLQLEDANAVSELELPTMAGVDLNSKFEIKPGIKSILQIEEFIKRVNQLAI